MSKKRTVVIDGDWLAFVGACMTHITHYIAVNKENNQEIVIETTEKSFTKSLEKLGLDVSSEDISIIKEKRLIPNWQATAKGVMLGKANKIKREVSAQHILIAIGGKTNFRDRLPLLYSSYKDRVGSYRPPNLKEVRELLKSLLPYEESIDMEADDIISMYQFKGRTDQSYIVCTEDKDAKQTPGFLYNPRKMEIRDCNGFGKLIPIIKVSETSGKETFKLDGYGRLWFYYQIICGDAVDTYHPFPKKVSDKAFYNIFKDIDNDKDAWTVITDWYKKNYDNIEEYTDWSGTVHKGKWIDILQTYVNVVHMLRFENDYLDIREILKHYDLLEEGEYYE